MVDRDDTLFRVYNQYQVTIPEGYRFVAFADVQDIGECKGINSQHPSEIFQYLKGMSGFRVIVEESPGAPASVFPQMGISDYNQVPKSHSWFDALPDVKIEIECNKGYGLGSVNCAESGTWWMI